MSHSVHHGKSTLAHANHLPIWQVALVLTCANLILHHHFLSVFEGLGKLSQAAAVRLDARQGLNQSAKTNVVVLMISAEEYLQRFSGISPLPREQMAAYVTKIDQELTAAAEIGMAPSVIVLDFDLSPSFASALQSSDSTLDEADPPAIAGPKALVDIQERLNDALRKLASDPARRVVLPLPFSIIEGSVIEIRYRWVAKLCAQNIDFAVADLPTSTYGLLSLPLLDEEILRGGDAGGHIPANPAGLGVPIYQWAAFVSEQRPGAAPRSPVCALISEQNGDAQREWEAGSEIRKMMMQKSKRLQIENNKNILHLRVHDVPARIIQEGSLSLPTYSDRESARPSMIFIGGNYDYRDRFEIGKLQFPGVAIHAAAADRLRQPIDFWRRLFRYVLSSQFSGPVLDFLFGVLAGMMFELILKLAERHPLLISKSAPERPKIVEKIREIRRHKLDVGNKRHSAQNLFRTRQAHVLVNEAHDVPGYARSLVLFLLKLLVPGVLVMALIVGFQLLLMQYRDLYLINPWPIVVGVLLHCYYTNLIEARSVAVNPARAYLGALLMAWRSEMCRPRVPKIDWNFSVGAVVLFAQMFIIAWAGWVLVKHH